MDASEVKAVSHERDYPQCVRVAVNIRPLVTSELLIGCADCITVVPGEQQVQIGSHAFTFDYVFGNGGLPHSTIYRDCVAPLVDALFHGYNATVLAYGQTGSGKTYTMGTNYTGNGIDTGIIPYVIESIFSRVETMDPSEFFIRVSFIEIFKEEVFDLLDPNSMTASKVEGASHAKNGAPARVPIQIRETTSGGITLAGVIEAEVRTKEEMASYLSRGSLCRATASTNMNSQSSRSHAIFTISMEQKRLSQLQSEVACEDVGDDILSAKLHLVDLAGSERAKRTGADGMRFKEGIHINKGLLALGNVISALGDEKKRKEGGHVPYRDSKLTRLLQDSLGGNSKTIMIACISPADSNAEETLNTLKYANRARNIQNKAVINRDPMAAQMQRMRSQIEQLQAELIFFRVDASAPIEELQILKQKNSLLEAKNIELQREVKQCHITCEHLAQRAIDAQVEKDKFIMRLEAARTGKSLGEIDANLNQEADVMKQYVTRIQELEGELLRLQKIKFSNRSGFQESLDTDDDEFHRQPLQSVITEDFSSSFVSNTLDSCDTEDDEKELEHSSIQENLDRELQELDQKLEQKEAEMKQITSASTLKQLYEKKVLELEQEKKALLKEIDELRNNLANISTASDNGAQKLKQDSLKKLNALEAQVSELKKKQDAQSELLRQKQRSDEAAKRLQDEIQRIKSQKVQLQHKIKQESEQFRLWKASREKEVLQLKKEGRRNEYEMHKLLALNQRQKMVLQRKTEEAAMATKRLKELLESRKPSSREIFGAANSNGPGIQALMQAIEHELEVTVRVHEVRSEYEHQMEERARMAKEISKLKEEEEMIKQTKFGGCPEMMSPGARNSRIFALENMLATSSSTLVSMASQLSEAEERERLFIGRGRWNQIRSLAEGKNLMNYLFNISSSSRCQLRGKEADCREKDSLIRELKEKVVELSCLVRQHEMQKQELKHQETSLNADSKEHGYDLRKGRSSIAFIGNDLIPEDMDISDSEHSDDEDWVASETEMEATGEDTQPSKKRTSKVGSFSTLSSFKSNRLSLLKTQHGGEQSSDPTTGESCCTCSKTSTCKTLKCQCRAARGVCGALCGCLPSKCSNRNAVVIKEESSEPDDHDGTGNCSEADEAEKSLALASHGVVLLQGAFADNPGNLKDDSVVGRKPLFDIGNTQVKPTKGQKWKKHMVQLVPVAPLPPQPEPSEALEKSMENVREDEIPLKLPRARRSSMASNSNQLKERNTDHSSTLALSKKPAARGRVSWQSSTVEEKENRDN